MGGLLDNGARGPKGAPRRQWDEREPAASPDIGGQGNVTGRILGGGGGAKTRVGGLCVNGIGGTLASATLGRGGETPGGGGEPVPATTGLLRSPGRPCRPPRRRRDTAARRAVQTGTPRVPGGPERGLLGSILRRAGGVRGWKENREKEGGFYKDSLEG